MFVCNALAVFSGQVARRRHLRSVVRAAGSGRGQRHDRRKRPTTRKQVERSRAQRTRNIYWLSIIWLKLLLYTTKLLSFCFQFQFDT